MDQLGAPFSGRAIGAHYLKTQSWASAALQPRLRTRSTSHRRSDNTNLIGLLNALGGGVLRIGANSVDETTWTPDGTGQTSGQVAPDRYSKLCDFDTEVFALEDHLWRQLSG
jgi:hypothetical protein